MDCIVRGVAKSRTPLSSFHFQASRHFPDHTFSCDPPEGKRHNQTKLI